jgi:fimbrial chaperone protein
VALLATAGLVIRSVQEAADVDTGMRTEGVFLVDLDLEPLGLASEVGSESIEAVAAQLTLVQVEALAWNDTADLAEVPRTSEILAVPPVFEIAGGAEQLIRLALRKPLTSDTERAYRLLITEVPRTVGDDAEGVSFALRLNLPVFVTPAGALPQPSWSLERSARGARLTLGNQGNAHVRVQSIALFEDNGAIPVFVSDDGGYVLAGGERSWQLDLGRLKAGAALTVKAETNLGELEARVDIRG